MQKGVLTAVQLTEFYLARIAAFDQNGVSLNAIQTLNTQAREQAAALDAERQQSGPRSALHGIPVLVKDNYETKGMPTSAGSVLFAGFTPDRDATLVARLKAAGAVILGKTTMHEFAYGITTVGSAFGATKNPYAPARNPGGSSGGTGAAVAANFAVVGMGSDTCGSIRIPAAQNNLVGLRGTQGLASRSGIVPLSSTQDIGGPLARTVTDLALTLDVIVGFDPQDPQTAESHGRTPQQGYRAGLAEQRGVKIGLLSDWLVQDMEDAPVAEVVRKALAHMQTEAGWRSQNLNSAAVNEALQRPFNGHYVLIHDFKTDIESYLAANSALGYADLNAILADGRTHPDIAGSLAASAAMTADALPGYHAELAQRQVVRQALLELLAEHDLDALAYPTIRRIAAPLGEEQMGTNCRLAANSGLPAISVPVGFVDGVPVGLELLAEAWSETKLLSLAYTLERLYPQRRAPQLEP